MGFPSQAEDFIDKTLDFNKLFMAHPEATFCVEVDSDSMKGAGIFPGDRAIVDRSLTAKHNSIIVARLNDEIVIKRLYQQGKSIYLVPANPLYKAIKITEETEFEVWGVVVYTIHRMV